MANYTKDELIALIQENPEEFNNWKKDEEEIDLSEVDFSNISFRCGLYYFRFGCRIFL